MPFILCENVERPSVIKGTLHVFKGQKTIRETPVIVTKTGGYRYENARLEYIYRANSLRKKQLNPPPPYHFRYNNR